MRIRIIQKPDLAYVDGVRLSGFQWGFQYDVNATLGAYLIAQGWADTLIADEPDALTSSSNHDADEDDFDTPINLRREFFPTYYDGPSSLALDRRRHKRRR